MEQQAGLSRSDRDILVAVATKQDLMAKDVADIKIDLVSRIAKSEARLDVIDIYHAGIPLKEYEDIAKWTMKLRTNLKFILMSWSFVVGALGAYISTFFHK